MSRVKQDFGVRKWVHYGRQEIVTSLCSVVGRFVFFLALTSQLHLSWAALGRAPEPVALPALSAAAPGKALAAKAQQRPDQFQTYRSQLDNGCVVLEYASNAGVVFALSWRGPVLPDLASLLGEYFPVFKQEAEKIRLTGRRGSSLTIDRVGLIVRSNGRMRNFFGYAYAPELVPPGVEIKNVLP